ncbi:hypothetical protein [Pelagicoccus sp. SDUM812002]|uniref:hypothetical protein n=1 Tax=Pelagicoccus sp. SDUM812002 TaxID=3041266 RepID=UPI00280EE451|nr:hypothetical protein [Pelagicoccus sp. SDUM812002]MDQ8183950.1 hypothetical protein [Pelagicoccus sp. SDUM812002]
MKELCCIQIYLAFGEEDQDHVMKRAGRFLHEIKDAVFAKRFLAEVDKVFVVGEEEYLDTLCQLGELWEDGFGAVIVEGDEQRFWNVRRVAPLKQREG